MRTASVLLVLLFLALPARADDTRCPGGDTLVDVTVTTDRGGVRLSNAKSVNDLMRLGGSIDLRGGRILGLTRMNLDYRMEANTRVVTRDRKRYCVSLRRVKVHLGFKDFRVFVARRYHPGTCPYRVTKAHEMRHVSLYRREMDDAIGPFKARVADVAKRVPVVWTEDPQAATRDMVARIGAAMRSDVQALERRMRIANRKIDTPAAYRLEHAKCPKW